MNRFCLHIFQSRRIFILTLLVIIYGMFFIPDGERAPRFIIEISNLGHIAAFFLIWTFAFNQYAYLQRLSTARLILLVLVTTIVVAALIEYLQGLIGRDDEWQDVWDSAVGALLATAFCATQIYALARWPRLFWRALALSVLIAVPWPIWTALTDEVEIWRQYPVLSDFSTPFEISRWQANRARLQVQTLAKPERRVLDVEFRPGTYSTVTLENFYPDWRAYRQLVLDVSNPETDAYRVILRVHDRLHKKHHYALTDRFNKTLNIQPGRQRIVIPLEAVKTAPHTRTMDMRHLEELSLFTMKSNVYHHLYINAVYLE